MLQSIEQNLHLPTRIDKVTSPAFTKKNCEFYIKRDDLIHPHLCGNKWRKLKYNFYKAFSEKKKTIITFGGAFSNHLVAVAAAGYMGSVKTVGLIRSYKSDDDNPTIRILRDYNMELIFVHPSIYDLKENHPDTLDIIEKYPEYYLIPEGGTNELALRGIAEMMEEVDAFSISFTHIITGIGTCGTLAGIIKSATNQDVKIIGISPFKGPVKNFEGFKYLNSMEMEKVEIIRSTPETRFGSLDHSMVEYIRTYKNENDILLDPIYTAKVAMTTEYLLEQMYFEKKSKILMIHSGGMQGISGFEYRHNCRLS